MLSKHWSTLMTSEQDDFRSLNTSASFGISKPEGCAAAIVQFNVVGEVPNLPEAGLQNYTGSRARCGSMELRDDFPVPALTSAQFEALLGGMCLGCPNRKEVTDQAKAAFL